MRHGGDLSGAAAAYGIAPDDWLDLSTGINPAPYPLPDLPAECFTRLPDSAGLRDLEAAAREAYLAHDSAKIVAAPGAQALIQTLPRTRGPCAVAVVGPTYGEHERAWRAAGHDVMRIDWPEAGAGDVLVVVNPNTPDGRRWNVDQLLGIAAILASRGGLLVVDEAFADPYPEISLAPYAGQPGLVVLRSFGKFYGLAGLRLGFALAAPRLARQLTEIMGPWAVSGPAIWAGRCALADRGWAEATRARLSGQAWMLKATLETHGLRVLDGTSLFRLAEHDEAHALHGALARQGVWARRFDFAPAWLRFGLPGDEAGFRRLDTALGVGLRMVSRSTSGHAVIG